MKYLLACLFLLSVVTASAQYTRQDTLRGSNGRGRDWWDVLKYDLTIFIDTPKKSLHGYVQILFKIPDEFPDSMQIDLQEPMEIRSADAGERPLAVIREGNVYWIIIPKNVKDLYQQLGVGIITIDFEGKPRIATNPPWDGGLIWTKDSSGKPWIAVACQGLGASSWWPCKDYQGDEPDSGMTINMYNAADYTHAISNGRFEEYSLRPDIIGISRDTLTSLNQIYNPINTYSTTFYIGDYAHWQDTFHGEKGILDLDFYPLRYNLAKAKKHWAVTKDMLRCFEYWLGPYPFYEDGYKLVEAPYLGMEHQSAIAYGNGYQTGYNGRGGHMDRSGTGVGFAFDFIIIHESGHEWFGNSITAQDPADNWLHEGFTTYTETLFAEWIRGRDSAFAYATGQWKNIKNDRPVIGDYGVNDHGSSDKYDKGAAVVHMIRMMINDDSAFRQLLRGLNRDFYHKIVTSKEVEDYISRFVGWDLKPFFDVYLRGAKIPTLVLWTIPKERKVYFTWKDANPYFKAPVAISMDAGKTYKVCPRSPDELSYDTYIQRRDMRVKPLGLFAMEEREK